MADDAEIILNQAEWNALAKEFIATEGVARMQKVADACNDFLDEEWRDQGYGDGYRVSTEGDNPLTKRDYRATCITANWGAIVDNASSNRLVQNFYLAGGDL